MSSATEIPALDKQVEETSTPKHGDLHQDVEVGVTDIERVEKVYE